MSTVDRVSTSHLFAGSSEMHARVREFDWAATSLGPIASWPQSLKTVVKTLLASRYPMILTWGPDFLQFYNDAYSDLIGDKHPQALGEDIRVTLAEGWDTLGPLIRDVMASGVANWNPALLLVLERVGYREEAYFDVSHAPAEDDDGAIMGMLAVCSEVTEQVLGERRLRLLRDLAIHASDDAAVPALGETLIRCVAQHPLDVPFALLYLREGDQLVLRASTGIAPGTAASPRIVDLAGADSAEPLARAAAGEPVMIGNWDSQATVMGGPWNEPVTTALALPLVSGAQTASRGVLLAGVSPNRALDEPYRSFMELLSSQIGAALGNAQAHAEERERSAALAELDRVKTEFFSNVSHEFRTPLTLMLGPLEELLADPSIAPAGRENLNFAHRNALRLLKLVNTLLDFSRTEADRARAVYEPVDLAALTADLASIFRSAIERAGLRLTVDCQPLPEPVYVDPGMWEKIVLNLLSNAFKFTHAGAIAVCQRQIQDQIELTVSDTGTGIGAADLANIFERFHRVEGAEGRTHEGTGIGLALVRELVQLHGGSVEAESEPGRGSTFRVTLPVGAAHLAPDRIAQPSRAPSDSAAMFLAEALRWQAAPDAGALDAAATNRPRILLADDNGDMRDYVRKLLAPRYDVVAVGDGRAALDVARAQLPDLILSDIMMPKLDGVELLAELRADPHTRTIPVILLSARAGEDAEAAGLETGADDYLTKPFAARDLLARVTTHRELARMRREAEAERARRGAAEATVRERDQFLSLAAHELKTPITGIKGYVELLLRRLERSAQIEARDRRALVVIGQQVERLSTLVGVLLDLSRLETGQFALERKQLDLSALLRRIADDTELLLQRHQLELILPAEPLVVQGDALRLEQVLQNLLGNAIKYSPGGGLIQLSAMRTAAGVVIAVRDQGVGIPATSREQIFERFFRASNADPQQITGLGIGLYVVREIVAQHGGTIAVESEEGAGSTFRITLPDAPESAAPTTQEDTDEQTPL